LFIFTLRPLSCQKLILILSIKLSKSSPQPSNQLKIQHLQKQKPDEIKKQGVAEYSKSKVIIVAEFVLIVYFTNEKIKRKRLHYFTFAL
jgi:hypothetical protein